MKTESHGIQPTACHFPSVKTFPETREMRNGGSPLRRAVLFQITIWFGQLSWAQLPDFYRTVDHVQWVVKDLNSVTSAWSRLGFKTKQQGTITIEEAQFAGVPVTLRVRRATGYLGALRVEWVQPIGDRNAYAEFLQMHGDGVFSLVHRVGTLDAFRQEMALLNLGELVCCKGSPIATLLELRRRVISTQKSRGDTSWGW
ncbi:MAG: hypothetical protein FJW26_13210 [Acidimicrobiia bacterium]|nr:hypothetical protein [Acidimicrobiia bacterium]